MLSTPGNKEMVVEDKSRSSVLYRNLCTFSFFCFLFFPQLIIAMKEVRLWC